MARPQNFSYVHEDLVAGSAHPGRGDKLRETLQTLQGEGFGGILTLTEEPLEPAVVGPVAIDTHHIAVDDFTAPTPDQIDEAIRFMQGKVGAGQRVLVHCRAGIGRTGTILACYLVAEGMEPVDAIRTVRRLRPGSVEVYQQEFAVYEFGKQLARRRDES